MKKDQKPSSNLRDLLRNQRTFRSRREETHFQKTHFTIWYFVIAFLIILLIQNYMMTKKTEDVIPYSEFKEALRAGKIKDLTITPESITGERETEKGLREISDRPGGRSGPGQRTGGSPCPIYGKDRQQMADQYSLLDHSPRLLLYHLENPLLPDRARRRASCPLERAVRKSMRKKRRRSPSSMWPGSTRPKRN